MKINFIRNRKQDLPVKVLPVNVIQNKREKKKENNLQNGVVN